MVTNGPGDQQPRAMLLTRHPTLNAALPWDSRPGRCLPWPIGSQTPSPAQVRSRQKLASRIPSRHSPCQATPWGCPKARLHGRRGRLASSRQNPHFRWWERKSRVRQRMEGDNKRPALAPDLRQSSWHVQTSARMSSGWNTNQNCDLEFSDNFQGAQAGWIRQQAWVKGGQQRSLLLVSCFDFTVREIYYVCCTHCF